MRFIQTIGDFTNRVTNTYYAESAEELESFEDVPAGSTGMILTENGLVIKMYHSTLGWIEI
jgi:hypothetical protein